MSAPVHLALELARRPVAAAHPVRFLAEVARQVRQALDLDGVVVLVPGPGWVGGSDETATLVGELQQRDGNGPLLAAVRTGRMMTTPDLRRVGPPALAALAGDAGLVSAVAVALAAGGRPVAGLHLLGGPGRDIDGEHVEALAPVLDVLGARVADLVEIARMRGPQFAENAAPPAPQPAVPPAVTEVDDHTTAIPAQPAWAARTPEPARHRPTRPRVVRSDPTRADPVRIDRLTPVRPDANGRAQVPVPADGEPYVPVPLSRATPELATEELRAIGADHVPLPHQQSRSYGEN